MIRRFILGIGLFIPNFLNSSPIGNWIKSKDRDAFESYSSIPNIQVVAMYILFILIAVLIIYRIIKFFELPKKLKVFHKGKYANLLDEPKVDDSVEVISSGLFDPHNISIVIQSGVKSYPDNVWELIDIEWNAANSIQPEMTDYSVLSLVSSTISETNIQCSLQKTSYKAYFGTNLRHPNHPCINGHSANAISIHIILETRDKQILLLFRKNSVIENKSHWELPCSFIKPPAEDVNKISIFEVAENMMMENFGLKNQNIISGTCLGFAKTNFYYKPSFFMYFKLSIIGEFFLDTIRPILGNEYENFTVVKNYDISDFLSIHKFTPLSKSAIIKYLDLIYEKSK